MSTTGMSTSKIGAQLRKLREAKGIPLRKAAALIDIDVAILSKMERGERRLNKEVIEKLAKLYDQEAEELLVLFLSDKIVYEIGDDDLALKAMMVAEKEIKYKRQTLNSNAKPL
jgi:transcriptional regulator with XRE-family HTH domain